MSRVVNYANKTVMLELSDDDLELIKFHYETQTITKEILNIFVTDSIDFLREIKSSASEE